MNIKEVTDFFADLSNEEKADLLCQLAFELTIAARETYEIESEGLSDPKLMRSINEVQHRILGQASKLLHEKNSSAEIDRYESILWQMVFDDNDEELHRILTSATSHVLTHFAPVLV